MKRIYRARKAYQIAPYYRNRMRWQRMYQGFTRPCKWKSGTPNQEEAS